MPKFDQLGWNGLIKHKSMLIKTKFYLLINYYMTSIMKNICYGEKLHLDFWLFAITHSMHFSWLEPSENICHLLIILSMLTLQLYLFATLKNLYILRTLYERNKMTKSASITLCHITTEFFAMF